MINTKFIVCTIVSAMLYAGAYASSIDTSERNLTIRSASVWNAQCAGTLLIAGTPGKTLSLRYLAIISAGAGGTCSIYDASSATKYMVPLTNQGTNTHIMIGPFKPGQFAVNTGNGIKCSMNAAMSLMIECWEQ